MVRRTLTGFVGATILALTLASPALADEPNGNETFASGSFTRTIEGVDYAWFVQADRDTVLGTSVVFANYNTAVDTTCDGGEAGARFITFNGQASVPVLIPRTLGLAIAAARVHGTETTFDLCTGIETQVNRSFAVALALVAIAPPVTSTGEKCVDTEHLLTSTFTFRTATGSAFVNGRRFAVSDGIIGHQVWSTRAEPTCADV